MPNKYEFCFLVQYESDKEAEIIFASLIPEIQEQRFDRSKVSIELKAQKIKISVIAQDTNAAKATVSSILRWISSTTKALLTLSKQTFN